MPSERFWYGFTAEIGPARRHRAIFNELTYITSASYDSASGIVSTIDGLARVKTITWDAASNKNGTAYSNGTLLTLIYDPLNRLTTMVDWTGTTTYAFDPRSLMTGKSDPANLNQAYVYDQVGNRTLLVDPNGGYHSFTLDALNRQTKYVKPTNYAFTSMYDPNSRLTTMIDGMGSSQIQTFDAMGRAFTLIQYSPANSPVVTVVDGYDSAGRKTSQFRDSLTTNYQYDAASRLTGQQATGRWATLVYDAVDNVLVKAYQGQYAMTFMFDAASRITSMIQGATVTNYTYNAAGNLTLEAEGAAQTGYVYNGENMLLKLTNPDGTIISNTYSGDGLRRTTQQPGKPVSTIIWDGQNYLGQM